MRTSRWLVSALFLAGVACTAAGSRAPATAELSNAPARAVVVLVSIDGFRYDYLDRYPSPNLHRLVAAGVRAPLVANFPTKTFPNHYSIVTGLFPAHHGVLDNTMYDPEFDAAFRMGDSAAQVDPRWWGGEPIWVTAEKQGRIAASFFWPGSEAPIEGIRPHYWEHYDGSIPDSDRVRQVLDWLAPPGRASADLRHLVLQRFRRGGTPLWPGESRSRCRGSACRQRGGDATRRADASPSGARRQHDRGFRSRYGTDQPRQRSGSGRLPRARTSRARRRRQSGLRAVAASRDGGQRLRRDPRPGPSPDGLATRRDPGAVPLSGQSAHPPRAGGGTRGLVGRAPAKGPRIAPGLFSRGDARL
jgi:Type I phosphodiesterase / nucleotide pyrophosphatase